MTDYKHTLNLPETDFPMRGNLAKREPETLARWEKMDIYKAIREARSGCESTFCTMALHTPTATFTSVTV